MAAMFLVWKEWLGRNEPPARRWRLFPKHKPLKCKPEVEIPEFWQKTASAIISSADRHCSTCNSRISSSRS